MKSVKLVPQKNIEYEANELSINVALRTAKVVMSTSGSDNDSYYQMKKLDLQPIIDVMTTTQKNIVKGFFNEVFRRAWNVESGSVSGSVFE